MRNIVLEITYDGSRYAGLQVQNNAQTIQGVIETGLRRILHRFERIRYAGRTDAGVHALGQVVSFYTENNMTPGQFKKALNSIIPADVRIHSSYEAPLSFHPRYSAKKRWYRYIISTSRTPVPFFRNYALWVDRGIDVDLLNRYAEYIRGNHDFSSFARVEAGENPNREVFECQVQRRDDFITLDIIANSFLRKMVRTIVGTFLDLERHSQPPSCIMDILASADRSAAGKTAFAGGLYLVKVFY